VQQRDAGHASGQIVMTTRGWVILCALVCGLGIVGYKAWQGSRLGEVPGSAEQASPQARPEVHGAPSGLQSAPAVQRQAGPASTQQLTADVIRESQAREIQVSAWRAAAAANRQQIQAIADSLQSLDERVDAIEKAAAAAPAATLQPAQAHTTREGVTQVAAVSKSIHQALDTARATANLDVTSLPLQVIPAQTLNVTGFGNGVVQIGGQNLSVGQSLQKGETIMAVDPESHSIVTNQRIISVTN